MSSSPEKTTSNEFEKNLRQTADDIHPRPAFVAGLRVSLVEQQERKRANSPRFAWARPLIAQGGLLALLAGLIALALFLTPQIVPDLRSGKQVEVTATPLPDEPIADAPNGLPTGALARLGQGQILTMDTAQDGRLAVGSTLGICVYNIGHTADWCRPFGLAYQIGWLIFNPSGDRLAVALSDTGGEGKIIVLDAASGLALAAHPFPNAMPGLSFQDAAMAWEPSGQSRLAIPGETGTLLIWDWQSDAVVLGPLDIRDSVSSEEWFSLDWAIDPQGRSLLAAGGRNGLLLLDGETGQEHLRLDRTWQAAPVGNISALDLSADGRWLAYGYDIGAVALRIEGGQVIDRKMWEMHWQPMQLSIGPESLGMPLAVQGKEGAQIIPLEGEGSPITVPANYGPLAWDPAGTLYFSRADGMLGIYQDGQDNIIGSEYSVWPEKITWDSAGGVLSLHAKAITHWDTGSGRLVSVSSIYNGNPVLLAVSPDGARAAYYMEGEAAFNIWDTVSNQAITRLQPAYRSSLAAFSADGSRLVSIGPNGQLAIWDTSGGQAVRDKVIREMDAAPLNSQLDGLAVTPDGRIAAIAWFRDGVLHLDVWDLEKGARTQQLPIDTNVAAMAWSPDGRTLADASSGYITLWDAASGQRVQSMGPEISDNATDAIYPALGRINAIAWSPDGKTLATGGSLVMLWNAEHGLPLRAFGGHRGMISDLAFRQDGLVLASSSNDGTIMLWDVGAGGLPIEEQQPTATPLPVNPVELTALSLPVDPLPTTLPEDGLRQTEPALSEQTYAGNVLWNYLKHLAADADNPNEYQSVANLYGGSWQELMALNPDVPGNNLPGLIERACKINGYHCGPVQQLQTAGERDGYLFEVDYVDGSWARFRVKKNANGEFLIMDLPPRKE